MNTQSTSHIYSFTTPTIHICVKAKDLSAAIDEMRDFFGADWLAAVIDEFDIQWYKPNHK